MYFPEKMYVGIRPKEHGQKTPLAFLVPDGVDAAAKKRKSTVDQWATPNWNHPKTKPNTVILDNVPRSGFKIVDDINRSYFGGGNIVWRVEDPNGFQFEISSDNLSALIQDSALLNGTIQGECIYARDGSKNALVLVNSQAYVDAIAHTNRRNSKFNLSNLKVGHQVTFVDGTSKFYLGKVWVSGRNYIDEHNVCKIVVCERMLFWSEPDKPQQQQLFFYNTPRIASMSDQKTSVTVSDVVSDLNKYLAFYMRFDYQTGKLTDEKHYHGISVIWGNNINIDYGSEQLHLTEDAARNRTH